MIERNVQMWMGPEMRVEFGIVEHIPRLPNGKFRYVISKVPLNYDDTRQIGEVLGIASDKEKTP